MTSEPIRIADQLRRAFTGNPWHGYALSDLLADVTAERALLRPLESGHSIWELVLHIDLWVVVALEAASEGTALPKLYGTEKDWPAATDGSAQAWRDATDQLFEHAELCAHAIESFTESELQSVAPGREYDFYYLFHGIVQHSLYHAGQIAMLKQAA